MEAVPRLPMISFELKISPDRPPTDFGKLKHYIRDFYHEDPEAYSTEIHNLEALRATAVRPTRDVNGCSVLKKYFCQLHFLQSRFPLGKDGAAAVPFTWRDAYASMVCTLADIRFEMVAILHNIGALHSQLGAADNRTSAEGLKFACTHFQCAAWTFQHLKDSYPQPAGVDVSPDLMQFMQQICLAQAQECILEKSMTDNRKATINAKVAAQIVDYYNMALNALVQTGGADDGCILETVGAKIFKSWKKYVKFKQTYYGSVALLYQGMQAEEQQKMGERVTYLQAAFDKLTEAIRLAKRFDQPEAVSETLSFTMDIVEGKRKAAKNENEFIYHEKVPERDELPDVKGASLVKGIPFSVNDQEISGPDIFAKLVPMKAHEASSLYSEEKAKLFRKVGAMIDEKDEELVGFMSSLQLDDINAQLDPDLLPQELIDRCAALSAKPDAIQNLIDAMDRLTGLYHDVDAMLKEILELIKIEEAAETEYQDVMGSRPPSIVATDLTREANKYKEAHAKAAESNETLHKAMAQHIANLRVMSLPLPELHKQLPSLSVLNLDDNKGLKDVRHLLGKVDEMRRQRSMLSSQLRESVCNDDITSQLVTRPSENLQTIFTQELQKHSRYVSLIEQNLGAQEKILSALTDAYAEFSSTRKAMSEIVRQRNMILTALMSSYDAYEDLIAKSNKGLEFYRKLETNVTKLLQRVKGTCKVQEEEREQILIKNGKKLPSKVLDEPKDNKSTTSTSGLKLKDYLQSMKKDSGGSGAFPITNPTIPFQGPYNSTPANYGAVQTPPTQSSISYTDPVPNVDAAQPWVPSIRPAPVGSEGNAPELPNAAKVADLKSDLSQNYTYPTSGNYSYDSQYYYRSAQPSNTYNQTYYNTMKSQQPAGTVASTNNLGYPQHQTPATNPSAVQYPVQYTTAFPISTSGATENQYPHQYLNAQQTYNTDTNYPSLNYYQNNSVQGYQQGYQVPNAGNPQVSSGYVPNIQGFDSASTSPSHAVAAAAVNQKNNTVQQDTSYPQPNTATSNMQGYLNPPTTSTAVYTTPTTYASQYMQYNSQAAYNMYQTPVSGSNQYGENYQHQNNAAYWQQQYQQTQQPQQMQAQQPPNPSSSPQLQQQSQSPAPLSQSQHPVSDITSDQKWAAVNPYKSYDASSISTNYPGGYPNVYNNPVVPQTGLPTSTAASDPVIYPGQHYYPPSYPQQYQYPGEPTNSHYTHAGQQGSTSQTNSSQTSLQGQTFAAQYNIPPQVIPNESSIAAVNPEMYYSHQYGYQYNSNGGTTSQIASPVEQQSQMTPMSPMTYMQASDSLNSGMTMTYSQQHASGNVVPNTGADPNDKPESQAEPTSNIDLLAGLDFAVSETPLLPEPSKTSPVTSSTPPVTTSVPEKPNVRSEEVNVEEKLASLSLQPSIVSANTVKQPSEDQEAPPIVSTLNKEDKNKFPLKYPYSDPDVLSQFVTEVEKFEKFVDGLTSKTLNGPTTLDIKWKELQDIQDKDSQKLISVARCYPMKNRFSDILPYDVSRVELPSTKDDYINASHVKNIASNCPNFIATQSPMPSTCADFWTMVLEQQVEVVVCLVNDMEIKDGLYWPLIKGQEEKVGRVTVNLQSTNIRKHWVERIISVSDGRLSRNIVHLQFTEWPGSSFPASPGPFLSLASESLSLWSQQRGSGPVVVHCIAGVGRTGLFIITTAAICEIQMARGLPDLITLAASVSLYRKNVLHDREHLKFAYQSLLYYSQDLLMKRGILASRSSFEEKRPKSHTRHPSQDFLLGPPKEVSSNNLSEAEQSDASNNTGENLDQKNSNDPLRQIDPMWPIKRFQ